MKFNLTVLCVIVFGLGLSRADVDFIQAPARVDQVAKEGIDSMRLGRLRAAGLTWKGPLRDYSIVGGDIAKGHLLSVARFIGWRYFLFDGGESMGAVDVVADAGVARNPQFGGFHQTDFSVETLLALEQAGKLAEIKQQNYEPRRLDVPSICFVALWLHGPRKDILLPLPPTFGRFQAYEVYTESQITGVLMPAAKREATFGHAY